MKVVVTRPADSAARTAARLEAMGHTARICPLFEPIHDTAGVARARQVAPDAIVVTSAEALRALQAAGNLADRPLFAVGSATAATAGSIGFSDVEAAEGDAAALAALLKRRLAGRSDPRILYLAGEPRMSALEQELAAARFVPDVVVCYRMHPIETARKTLDDLFSDHPDAVLLYSAATARRFFELAENHVRQCPDLQVLCLSPAIAAEVPAEFAARTRSAAFPRESDLLALL